MVSLDHLTSQEEKEQGRHEPGGIQVGKSKTEDIVKTAPPGKIVPVGKLHRWVKPNERQTIIIRNNRG